MNEKGLFSVEPSPLFAEIEAEKSTLVRNYSEALADVRHASRLVSQLTARVVQLKGKATGRERDHKLESSELQRLKIVYEQYDFDTHPWSLRPGTTVRNPYMSCESHQKLLTMVQRVIEQVNRVNDLSLCKAEIEAKRKEIDTKLKAAKNVLGKNQKKRSLLRDQINSIEAMSASLMNDVADMDEEWFEDWHEKVKERINALHLLPGGDSATDEKVDEALSDLNIAKKTYQENFEEKSKAYKVTVSKIKKLKKKQESLKERYKEAQKKWKNDQEAEFMEASRLFSHFRTEEDDVEMRESKVSISESRGDELMRRRDRF